MEHTGSFEKGGTPRGTEWNKAFNSILLMHQMLPKY